MIQCSTATRAGIVRTPGGNVEFDVRDGDERGKRYGVERGHEREFGAILEAKHQRKRRRRRQTIWWKKRKRRRRRVVFRQLFERESSTYTYLLGCAETRECLLIDPVLETVERDLQVIDDLGLTLKLCVNTHCHADHITGSGEIKKLREGVKSVISKRAGAMADVLIDEGDVVEVGTSVKLKCLSTPGHTVDA